MSIKTRRNDNTAAGGRRSYLGRISDNWRMYVFLILPVAYLIIFCYWPMYGAQIAFRNYKIKLGITGSEWVGLGQFYKFFSSYYAGRVIGNTLRLSFYSIVAGFPLPILLALMMNALRGGRYQRVSQTILYIPHFISVVVMVGIITQTFNARFGIFATLYRLIFGGSAIVPNILISADAFPHLYVWTDVWQEMGWGTVIYTAALAGVNSELHEAAIIDGATRFKRILHVDLPAIIPTISIMLILRFGQVMNIGFDKTYLLQTDANLRSSEVIATYIYKSSFENNAMNYSYSTAIGLFNSVINIAVLTVMNFTSRRISGTSLW